MIDVAFDPRVDVGALPNAGGGWLLVNVAGQYDHPDAGTCRATGPFPPGEPEPHPLVVVRDCRAQFVVTSISAYGEP